MGRHCFARCLQAASSLRPEGVDQLEPCLRQRSRALDHLEKAPDPGSSPVRRGMPRPTAAGARNARVPRCPTKDIEAALLGFCDA